MQNSQNSFQELFSHPFTNSFNPYSKAVLKNISTCHTAKRGYHLYRCDNKTCSNSNYQYHSCGNRHCPFCGAMKKEEWIENRTNELISTAYYHIVFTVPHELNPLFLGNRNHLLKFLMDCAAETLLKHGKNSDFLGAEIGITMVLHTWGQDLTFHPHVHCIVTGGGFDGEKWIQAKQNTNKFLFPVSSLQNMYKALFMKELERNTNLKWETINKEKVLKSISYKKWNVYAKAPFGGPAQVIEYLGRYTHKIAITKHRILEVKEDFIKFKYKDYADNSKTKTMWLKKQEFLRRFEQHILPKRFIKIRHYGFLQNRNKTAKIALIRKSMNLAPSKLSIKIPVEIRLLEKYGKDITKCTCCEIGKMVLVHDTRKLKSNKNVPLRTIFVPS